MSIKDIFKRDKPNFVKVIEESESAQDFTPDCPAIVELKQDKELDKELNIELDPDYYTLDDLLSCLKLSKKKITKCNISVKKVDDSILHLKFHEGTIILHSDFTFDWEV